MSRLDGTSPAAGELTSALAEQLGKRRSDALRRIMKRTGLPPENLLDLALELLGLLSEQLAPPPSKQQAVGLGTARWRRVSPQQRSEVLRKVAQARWAKVRTDEGSSLRDSRLGSDAAPFDDSGQ